MNPESDEIWSFTVLRGHGLHLMRPEKVWRPIVTLEVDRHHQYETTLGCDGQNINLKDIFELQQVSLHSRVEIKIWYRSQSKKKGKKKVLVASAAHSLGDLVRRQITESKVEIKLNCQGSASKRTATSSRGRPQRGALLHLKITPPPSVKDALLPGADVEYEEQCDSDQSSTKCSSRSLSVVSEPESWPPSDAIPVPVDDEQHLRHRVLRGYMDSDDEEIMEKPPTEDEPLLEYHSDDPDKGYIDIKPLPYRITFVGWIAASILPQYTETIPLPQQHNRAERFLATFTMYTELKEACTESQFQCVFDRLQMEWTYVGGILVALAAVDTAVFAISSDSAFLVSDYAKSAVATSSIASGLGVACDAWFLVRYNWASLRVFIDRAKDVYGSYFFFALSSRVPALCMFTSALSLLGFLGLVAFEVWPAAVMVACFLVGVLLSMQFLVFGIHWVGGKVVRSGGKVVRKMTGIGEKV